MSSYRRFSRRAHRTTTVIPCLAAAFLALASISAQDDPPDFDLRIPCRDAGDGAAGEPVQFESAIELKSAAPAGVSGAQGWSLSIGAMGAAVIVSATTAGTAGDAPPNGMRLNGFEKTELTTGSNNEGAVSAVVLSFTEDITLPPSGTAVVLRVGVEALPPVIGCSQAGITFRDGLRGSGQPVQNKITWLGASRRDDGGGPQDNDADGPENCSFQVCAEGAFLRGNCDGAFPVGLTDAIYALNYLFRSGPAPSCSKACDVTDDGAINITDPINLLNHLFLSGVAPPAPYPQCGSDPTVDALTCEEPPTCI